MPNNDEIRYTYDAKNRRIAKKVDGVITERLIYKDQLAPIKSKRGQVGRYMDKKLAIE